jgi:hypothetical protein
MTVEDPARGEVDIDYRRVPSVAPEGWPKVTTNTGPLSWLFYGDMVDTLRRVSEHVTIGSAKKLGRDIGAYFVLCRKEGP